MATEIFPLNSRTGNGLTGEVVNQYGGWTGDSNADVAILNFGPCSKDIHISQVTLNIGSISVGGNNLSSSTVETINIKCEWGSFSGSSAIIYESNDDTNADEKNGPSSASIVITPTDSTSRLYQQDTVVQIRVTVSSTQDAVGCAYTLSDFSLTVQYTATPANFVIAMEGNMSGDNAYLLLEGNNTTHTNLSARADNTVRIYAQSFDGRKILSLKQYEGSTLLQSISGSNLSPYLSEDGGVLDYPIEVTEDMEGYKYKLYVEFDKLVYVTYDSCFNYLKWYYEGLTDSTIISKTKTGHTIRADNGSIGSRYTTPQFPLTVSGTYDLTFDFSSSDENPYIYFNYSLYNANGSVSSGGAGTYSDGFEWLFLNESSVDFTIANSAQGSVVSFSNFLLYPSDYPYMSTTVPANQRTTTGRWNMPTPTREGYIFKGWNTKPDGTGRTYTSADPYPTEDLVLYSQWTVKPPVTIYVGQTQALRAYVGTQEIINIL